MKIKKAVSVLLCMLLFSSVLSIVGYAESRTGVTTGQVNVRSGPGTSHKLVYENLPKNVMVVVLEQVNCDDKSTTKPWYKVEFNYGGQFYSDCYISTGYVAIVNDSASADVPELYKHYISVLKASHPNWKFEFFYTDLDWTTVLNNEDKLGRSLISGSRPLSYRSKMTGAYDPATGKWIALDGSSWYQAHRDVVAYYLDPRNFLTNEQDLFQFELLSSDTSTQTLLGVQNMLKGTFMENKSIPAGSGGGDVTGDGEVDIADAMKVFQYVAGKVSSLENGASAADVTGDGEVDIADAMRIFQFVSGKTSSLGSAQITYAEAFIKAAELTGVSPYHLVSRVIQEVGKNGSGSTSGSYGSYPGIYNFYNIGASSGTDPVSNGLRWASTPSENEKYLRPWNSQYKSIVGGAVYIGEKYINAGQNTLYLEKFDVESNFNGLYWHQYMTNVEAAYYEAKTVYSNYKSLGLLSNSFTFRIPVYNNMPENPASLPLS